MTRRTPARLSKILETSEDGTVRTEHGWLDSSQIELATTPPLKATVDGQPAQIVLDGTVKQEPLVKLTLLQAVTNLAEKQAEIAIASSEAGRARKRVKDLKDQREVMIREACAIAGYEPTLFDGADSDEDEEPED